MTTEELKDYYKNLLIFQFVALAKARATVGAFAGEAIADQIIEQVRDGFDLDTAVGVQIDMMATYRNAPRKSPGLELNRVYMAMIPYDEAVPGDFYGFSVYADSEITTWFIRCYADNTNPTYTLTDYELVQLIKFLAQVNSSEHSLSDIDEILYDFFGTYVTLEDGADMTMTLTHDATNDPNTLFKIVNYLNLLPRPAGVGLTIIEV